MNFHFLNVDEVEYADDIVNEADDLSHRLFLFFLLLQFSFVVALSYFEPCVLFSEGVAWHDV